MEERGDPLASLAFHSPPLISDDYTMKQRFAISTLPVLLCLGLLGGHAQQAHGQVRGSFDIVVKGSAFVPQAGVALHFNESISLRGLFFFSTNGEDLDGTANIGVLFRTSPGRLSTYLGPSVTVLGDDSLLLGGIFGAEYRLSERFGVFGEIGLDIVVDGGRGLAMYNTGVGMAFGL